eukprot:GHVT01104963.1.p1 GENE.GHVT01104963.1~~GHVT01104963.1.p1  ORF type:complete len:666 (+),score=110.70 GHVT01104963.1:116-2113(+)
MFVGKHHVLLLRLLALLLASPRLLVTCFLRPLPPPWTNRLPPVNRRSQPFQEQYAWRPGPHANMRACRHPAIVRAAREAGQGVEGSGQAYDSPLGLDFQKLCDLLADTHATGVDPSTVAYNAALHQMERDFLPSQAVRLFTEMQAAGVQWDGVTLTALVSCLERIGDTDTIMSIYNQLMEQRKEYAKLALDNANGNIQKDLDLASSASALLPNATTPNSSSSPSTASSTTAARDAMLPDMPMYNLILSACARAADADNALTVLGQLEADARRVGVGGWRRRRSAYVFAITACVSGGRPEEALRLYFGPFKGAEQDERAEEQRQQAAARALNAHSQNSSHQSSFPDTAPAAVSLGRKPAPALGAVPEQPNATQGQRLSVATLNSQPSDSQTAAQTFKNSQQTLPSSIGAMAPQLLAALLKACEELGKWQTALAIFAEFGRDPSFQPTPMHLLPVLRVCARNGPLRAAEAVWRQLQGVYVGKEMPPAPLAFLVEAYCTAGDWQQATSRFQQLLPWPEAASVLTDSLLLAVLRTCRDNAVWYEARQILTRWKHSGRIPSVHHYNTVLAACANASAWEELLAVNQEFRMSLLGAATPPPSPTDMITSASVMRKPDVLTLTLLMQAYVQLGMLNEAQNIKRDLVSQNLEFLPSTHLAVGQLASALRASKA